MSGAGPAVVHRGEGRFVPASLRDWLMFPVDVANPSSAMAPIYVEWRSPDPRILISAVFLVVATLRVLWRRRQYPAASARGGANQGVRALVLYGLMCYGVWLCSSGDGRYALAWLMLLVIPLLHGVVTWTGPGRGRMRAVGIVALLALQIGYVLVPMKRFALREPFDWRAASLAADLPHELREQPWLHLSTRSMSWSYLAPQLHPSSELASSYYACSGCASLGSSALLRTVLDRWGERVRVWVPIDEIRGGEPRISARMLAETNASLAEFDRRVKPESCLVFAENSSSSGVRIAIYSAGQEAYDMSWLTASCQAEVAPVAAHALRQQRDSYDGVFARIEQACQKAIGLSSGQTEWDGDQQWWRVYGLRELQITVLRDTVFVNGYQRPFYNWGRLAHLMDPAVEVDCASLRRYATVSRRQ